MSHRTARLLLLTERVRRVCRLAPTEVAYLLLRHSAHLELLPTGQRDVYALTPGGVVGVIDTPSLRLVIRPKIPLANLFFLLDPLSPLPINLDRSTPVDGREALHFLAGQFALRLRERIDAGLERGYDEREMIGPFLLGRLDVAAQLRDAGAHKEQLHCRHDAFTADILCNRVIKTAAATALASPLLSGETRTALQAALRGLADVREIALTPDVWHALEASAPAAYRPLFYLGRLLADSLTPGEGAGDMAGPAFLLNLEQVFEHCLTRFLAHAVATDGKRRVHYRVASQPFIRATVPVAGQPDLNVCPDMLLIRDGRAHCVVDAKWKRLSATPLILSDVYQMLAYCSALDVRRAVLVYPGRRDQAWRYVLERTDSCVIVRRLRVIGDREALTCSIQRLMRLLLR